MKTKTTAAILALLLGTFGVHQFYLGNSGKGIAYLLFCWTTIPFFIGIIDFIILLSMSDGEFNQKYNMNYLSTIGQVVASATQQNNSTNNNNNLNVSDELEKLANLKDKGIITAEEFEAKKKELLK